MAASLGAPGGSWGVVVPGSRVRVLRDVPAGVLDFVRERPGASDVDLDMALGLGPGGSRAAVGVLLRAGRLRRVVEVNERGVERRRYWQGLDIPGSGVHVPYAAGEWRRVAYAQGRLVFSRGACAMESGEDVGARAIAGVMGREVPRGTLAAGVLALVMSSAGGVRASVVMERFGMSGVNTLRNLTVQGSIVREGPSAEYVYKAPAAGRLSGVQARALENVMLSSRARAFLMNAPWRARRRSSRRKNGGR